MLSISPGLEFTQPIFDVEESTTFWTAGVSPASSGSAGILPAPLSAPPFAYNKTFELHSKPDSSFTIYLDFNGHTTTATPWNNEFAGGQTIVTPPYSIDTNAAFSDRELLNIQHIWQRVSEDYLPFDVNVTTEEPTPDKLAKSGNGDTTYGVRVVIGGNSLDWMYEAIGGIAYIGSFSWNSDVPCFVFPQG